MKKLVLSVEIQTEETMKEAQEIYESSDSQVFKGIMFKCLKCGYSGEIEEFDLHIQDIQKDFSLEEAMRKPYMRPCNLICPKCSCIMVLQE